MRNKIIFYTIISLLTSLALLWLYINYINYGKSTFSLSVCMIKNTTGIPCASCGTTRSVLSLIRGSISDSIFYNPLGIIVLTSVLITPLILLFDLVFKKNYYYTFFIRAFKSISERKIWLPTLLFFIGLWIWNLYKYFNNLEI